MNITQFACLQRESLINLIYESCQQKQKLFTQILELAEQIHKTSQKSPCDDSVEDMLCQLKVMLQYTNQDISAHIDLALQQVNIARQISLRMTTKTISDSTRNTPEKPIQQVSITDLKQSNAYAIAINEKSEKTHNLKYEKYEKNDPQPQEKKVIQKNEKIHLSMNDSDFDEIEDEEIDIDDGGSDEDKFRKYQKDLLNIEEKYGIMTTPTFKDKAFFLSRANKTGMPVLKVLKDEDKEYLSKLVLIFRVQRRVAILLRLSSKQMTRLNLKKFIVDHNIKPQHYSLAEKSTEHISQFPLLQKKSIGSQPISQHDKMRLGLDNDIKNQNRIEEAFPQETIFNPFIKEPNSTKTKCGPPGVFKKMIFPPSQLLKESVQNPQVKVEELETQQDFSTLTQIQTQTKSSISSDVPHCISSEKNLSNQVYFSFYQFIQILEEMPPTESLIFSDFIKIYLKNKQNNGRIKTKTISRDHQVESQYPKKFISLSNQSRLKTHISRK